MNKVQYEDCQNIGGLDFINWDQLKGNNILITGSTGLIGSNLVNAIGYNNREKKLDVHLILPVRNAEQALDLFEWTGANIVVYKLGDELNIQRSVDYIIHLASPTSSKFFSEKPVDTMLANIEGLNALLAWAKDHPVKKFICLSTMEVYGFPKKGHKVRENELGAFETMNPRNSYPVAKIACEALCNSYYTQFSVPTVVLRATQTFGPGVKYSDGRVFAQFMRCVVENKNIVLKTEGLTERPYLYTGDCVSAILLCLLKGEPGQAYTVANPKTYCSIKDMAKMVADEIAEGHIQIEFDIGEDSEKLGYANTLFMDLDVDKLEALGWKPQVNLLQMYKRMIDAVK